MNLKQQQDVAKKRYEQYKFYLDTDSIVFQIMQMLNIPTTAYAIAGSTAMVAYGLNLDRMPHDIDVVVYPGYLNVIDRAIYNNPFISKIDARVNMSYSRLTIQAGKINIDILESEKIDTIYVGRMCKVVSPKHLYNIKMKWQREKDIKDIALIAPLIEE